MRIAVPDLISPSYFPAIAAVDLGVCEREGVDAELELLYPVTDAAIALARGEIDVLAGAAHAPLQAFPGGAGIRLLAALSQGMYWFLVVRQDLEIERGDLAGLGGLRIGVAPGPDAGLQQLLLDAGVDVDASGIRLGPVPGTSGAGVSFGVTAAEALAGGRVDAFWANGMGAEVAVRQGVGRVIVDARRDGHPPTASTYTFPALMATTAMLEHEPEQLAAVVRALVTTQSMLIETPRHAADVGERLFPPVEAGLIEELVRRDSPYYSPRIDEHAVTGLSDFAQRRGLVDAPLSYDELVATELGELWQAGVV